MFQVKQAAAHGVWNEMGSNSALFDSSALARKDETWANREKLGVAVVIVSRDPETQQLTVVDAWTPDNTPLPSTHAL